MRNCFLSAFTALALWGCASAPPPASPLETSQLDAQFGTALQEAITQQSVNPLPLETRDAPLGMDGQAARSSIDRYQKSFDSLPATATVFTTGTGSGAGSTAP